MTMEPQEAYSYYGDYLFSDEGLPMDNISRNIDSGIKNATFCDTQDEHFNFTLNGVIIGTLCILGIVGNTLSILVLQRDPNNKLYMSVSDLRNKIRFNKQVAMFLLQALAVADNSLLLVSFITLSLWQGYVLQFYPDTYRLILSMRYIPLVINPIGAMAQTATIWMTVLLAINRYIAVCKPFKAHSFCTLTKAKVQVACVIAFSVCFNLPRFFQYKLVKSDALESDPEGNGTSRHIYLLNETAIGESTLFGIIFTNVLYSILVLLLPLVLLIVLNTQLLREIHYSKRQARLNSMPSPSEANISFVMIVIIIVFIVCHTPDRLYQIFSLVGFFGTQVDECSRLQPRLMIICNLFVIINSSANFIIYYVCRKSFRKILRKKICNVFRSSDSSPDSSIRKSSGLLTQTTDMTTNEL